MAESTVRREVTKGTLCQLADNSVGPSVNLQTAEVAAALQKLNFRKAVGSDGISSKLLSYAGFVVADRLLMEEVWRAESTGGGISISYNTSKRLYLTYGDTVEGSTTVAQDVLYADDLAPVAELKHDLQRMLAVVDMVCNKWEWQYGLKSQKC